MAKAKTAAKKAAPKKTEIVDKSVVALTATQNKQIELIGKELDGLKKTGITILNKIIGIGTRLNNLKASIEKQGASFKKWAQSENSTLPMVYSNAASYMRVASHADLLEGKSASGIHEALELLKDPEEAAKSKQAREETQASRRKDAQAPSADEEGAGIDVVLDFIESADYDTLLLLRDKIAAEIDERLSTPQPANDDDLDAEYSEDEEDVLEAIS